MDNSILVDFNIKQVKCKADHPHAYRIISATKSIDKNGKKTKIVSSTKRYSRTISTLIEIKQLDKRYSTKYVFQTTPEMIEDLSLFFNETIPNINLIKCRNGDSVYINSISPDFQVLEGPDSNGNFLCGINLKAIT